MAVFPSIEKRSSRMDLLMVAMAVPEAMCTFRLLMGRHHYTNSPDDASPALVVEDTVKAAQRVAHVERT
jgi:hypothetical protein